MTGLTELRSRRQRSPLLQTNKYNSNLRTRIVMLILDYTYSPARKRCLFFCAVFPMALRLDAEECCHQFCIFVWCDLDCRWKLLFCRIGPIWQCRRTFFAARFENFDNWIYRIRRLFWMLIIIIKSWAISFQSIVTKVFKC